MFNVENSCVKYVGFCFVFLMYEAISSSSFSEIIPILGLMVPVIHIHHASSRGEEQNWRKDLGSPWLDPMNPDFVILPGNFYPAPLETFSLVNSPFLSLWPFSIPLTISSTLSSCKITCFYLYVCVYTCICICIYIYMHTHIKIDISVTKLTWTYSTSQKLGPSSASGISFSQSFFPWASSALLLHQIPFMNTQSTFYLSLKKGKMFPICLSYFYIGVIRRHNQGNL